eukprot:1146189-Pelagomonas_calceolata.AAC.1
MLPSSCSPAAIGSFLTTLFCRSCLRRSLQAATAHAASAAAAAAAARAAFAACEAAQAGPACARLP